MDKFEGYGFEFTQGKSSEPGTNRYLGKPCRGATLLLESKNENVVYSSYEIWLDTLSCEPPGLGELASVLYGEPFYDRFIYPYMSAANKDTTEVFCNDGIIFRYYTLDVNGEIVIKLAIMLEQDWAQNGPPNCR